MALKPVVLILGAGANIGTNVARVFASNGYKVALAARRLQDETGQDGNLHIRADLANPDSVKLAFEKVSNALGPPSVVIYNGSCPSSRISLGQPSNEKTISSSSCAIVPAKSPLDLSLSDYHKDLSVNTTSVLAAAKEAVKSFQNLPQGSSKTFIYTGNILNTEPIFPLFSLGLGKSATAHLISLAAQAYKDQGYQFYYADERKEDGTVAGGAISGAAHAQFYLDLASREEQGPWLATFVKDKGYVNFPGIGYVKAPGAA